MQTNPLFMKFILGYDNISTTFNTLMTHDEQYSDTYISNAFIPEAEGSDPSVTNVTK